MNADNVLTSVVTWFCECNSTDCNIRDVSFCYIRIVYLMTEELVDCVYEIGCELSVMLFWK
jgi:hypothetical protein